MVTPVDSCTALASVAATCTTDPNSGGAGRGDTGNGQGGREITRVREHHRAAAADLHNIPVGERRCSARLLA